MGTLTLIRHGQASFGAEDYDRLSPLGHQQCAWLDAYLAHVGLNADLALSGTLRRQRETLAGLSTALNGAQRGEDPRLNEMSYDQLLAAHLARSGDAMPQTRACFVDLLPRLMHAWSEGTLADQPESFAAFEARVLDAIDAVAGAGREVVLVTSGGVIGVVLRRVLGLDVTAAAHLMLNIRNASVHQFTFEFGGLRLAQFNGLAHLQGPARAHALTYV